jgi:hypothetical protein
MKKYKIAARREIAVKVIAVGLSVVIGIGVGFAAAQNKDSRESQPLMHHSVSLQGGRIGGIPSAERLSPFGPRGIVSMLRSGACVDVLIPQPV